AFQQENPSEQALEVFNLDSANKTEHYEIASYRGLIDQARVLGQDDVRRLLEQNLRQEEEMSRWIEEHQPEVLTRMQGVEGRSGARVRRWAVRGAAEARAPRLSRPAPFPAAPAPAPRSPAAAERRATRRPPPRSAPAR